VAVWQAEIERPLCDLNQLQSLLQGSVRLRASRLVPSFLFDR
jgi:hypothetical protein